MCPTNFASETTAMKVQISRLVFMMYEVYDLTVNQGIQAWIESALLSFVSLYLIRVPLCYSSQEQVASTCGSWGLKWKPTGGPLPDCRVPFHLAATLFAKNKNKQVILVKWKWIGCVESLLSIFRKPLMIKAIGFDFPLSLIFTSWSFSYFILLCHLLLGLISAVFNSFSLADFFLPFYCLVSAFQYLLVCIGEFGI